MTVASVHPVSPYPDDTGRWSDELGRLADVARRARRAGRRRRRLQRHSRSPPVSHLLATGYADAASQVGAGWLPTYPANRRRVPLLITIDHVLASDGIVATDVERVEIAGTDHAALVVRLAVSPGV